MRTLLAGLALFAAAAFAKPLEIYFIDVEGGKSTLIVSPSGQTLLIDTGYTGFSGRDVDRIATAAKLAHVGKKIDFVLITHHHADHEGGVPNLLERFQVGTFFDPGPNVDPGADQRTNKAYEAAMAKQNRKVVKPGDVIPIKGLSVKVVTANGAHIASSGAANSFCSPAPAKEDIPENARSAGVLIEMGKFRYADFGDLTADKEQDLLCPNNPLGEVTVYQSAHHGAESAKAIYALHPRVTVVDNGARKGGTPNGLQLLKASPGLEDMWQMHFSVAGGKEANTPDSMIANVDDPCEGKYLKLTAESNGGFTMFNSRNKYTKTYAPK